MQIKHQALAQQIQKKIAPLYFLTGQDNYLIEEALLTIKSTIKKSYDCEEKLISIQNPEDWSTLAEEANSYSLFSDVVLLHIYYDKKTIDATGKKILTHYLSSINPRCYIVIRAPNVPSKQLSWLTTQDHAVIVMAYPMNADGVKNWIVHQLNKHSFKFEPKIPDLIYQYTQGNMLACSQVIEKLVLCRVTDSIIPVTPTVIPTMEGSPSFDIIPVSGRSLLRRDDREEDDVGRDDMLHLEQVLEHLSNQIEISPFELVDACLLGQPDKAIQIIRHAANNKTESTLILWMLTQEVRNLLQLSFLLTNKLDLHSACSQLKIWPQRVTFYQTCIKRFNSNELKKLLTYCQCIDERIKSTFSSQVWASLETLALSLSLGRLIGETCAV